MTFYRLKTLQILLDCGQNVSWKLLEIIYAGLLDTLLYRSKSTDCLWLGR